MCSGKKRRPVQNVGGPDMGGHIIPHCWVTDRITIKLQLIGKPRLIFKFYSVTALRAHLRLQGTLHT